MENMVENISNFYKNKKIFLTGHTGFKGSWMLELLNYLNVEIKGYSLPPKNNNDLYNLISGNKKCNSIYGDINDFELLKKEIFEFQPDLVFHFAAQPLVKYSYAHPIETHKTNYIGTANLLEALKEIKSKCAVVLITTDKVYENQEWDYPYREVDTLGGYDPYSTSKACCELLISSYRNSFYNLGDSNTNIFLSSARAGNVIGGGDWSIDRIIPDIVRSILNNSTLNLRSPYSIRPWQHVLEPLFGYLILGYNLYNSPFKFSQSYNFGPSPNDNLSVNEVAKLAYESWPAKNNINYTEVQLNNIEHETNILKLDISKAKNELAWYPIYDAKNAIKLTIDWYNNYNSNFINIEEYTRKQVIDFLSFRNNKSNSSL